MIERAPAQRLFGLPRRPLGRIGDERPEGGHRVRLVDMTASQVDADTMRDEGFSGQPRPDSPGRAASYLDELFLLEDPHRWTQGGLADSEAGREVVLPAEERGRRKLQHLLPERAGDDV